MTQATAEPGCRQVKDTVHRQLREDIVTGVLPPGTVLREAELTARFGVSKTPLRDALVRLQKDGFVTIPPYRSAVVAGYSPADLREIYEVRELLEGACAREAAFHISADALAGLSRNVRASEACVTGGAVLAGRHDELTGLLQQFDLILYAQSRNSRIDEMIANIGSHVQRIGRLSTGIPGRLARSVPQHRAVCEAIVQRDGAGAEALMREHIRSVMADQLTSSAE
ncbi:MAG TPA: GntR family transcriptional regulator [Streptosporangiaceae bacterium]|jgi:DNA-binding GntR family transcriptional regulator